MPEKVQDLVLGVGREQQNPVPAGHRDRIGLAFEDSPRGRRAREDVACPKTSRSTYSQNGG